MFVSNKRNAFLTVYSLFDFNIKAYVYRVLFDDLESDASNKADGPSREHFDI